MSYDCLQAKVFPLLSLLVIAAEGTICDSLVWRNLVQFKINNPNIDWNVICYQSMIVVQQPKVNEIKVKIFFLNAQLLYNLNGLKVRTLDDK